MGLVINTAPVTDQFLDFYNLEIAKGKTWSRDFEVLLGPDVAGQLGLGIGDRFHSSHGLADDDMNEHDDVEAFTVVGILENSGTVADQLILCPAPTVWAVHDHDAGMEQDQEGHDHEGEGDHEHHEGHDHHDDEVQEIEESKELPPGSVQRLLNSESQEITSVLIRFKGRSFQALNMQRNINENTDLQAATPAIEINRLYSLMGVGADMLRTIAIAILLVSALSVFLLLFHSLRTRKYELALMRVMGGRPGNLFSLIIWEGILISVMGCIAGIFLAHFSMEILAGTLESSYRYPFTGLLWDNNEYLLLAGAVIIGVIAALIPGWRAQRTDISKTLAG